MRLGSSSSKALLYSAIRKPGNSSSTSDMPPGSDGTPVVDDSAPALVFAALADEVGVAAGSWVEYDSKPSADAADEYWWLLLRLGGVEAGVASTARVGVATLVTVAPPVAGSCRMSVALDADANCCSCCSVSPWGTHRARRCA